MPPRRMNGGSGDEKQSGQKSNKDHSYHHDPYHRSRLEHECHHPDEYQRNQISEELGLSPSQTQSERSDSNALRVENKKIQSENEVIRELLKSARCRCCGGPAIIELEKHERNLQNLKMENVLLVKEYERASLLLSSNTGLPPMLLSPLASYDSLQNQRGIPSQNIVDIPAQNVYPPLQIYQLNPDPNLQIPIMNQAFPPLDQHIPTPTVPAIDNIQEYNLDVHQDIPLITSLDYNVPALITNIEHRIPTFDSLHVSQDDKSTVVDQQAITQEPNDHIVLPSPSLNQDVSDLPALDMDLDSVLEMNNNIEMLLLDPPLNTSTDMEKVLMMEIASTAIEELMKLLNMNEPLWRRSRKGKLLFQRNKYLRIFPKNNHLKGPDAYIEASKDSRVVNMGGAQLIEMFMNSMRAEMHILSPLVPSREFLFLRYCKQIQEGLWVIGDVSFDSSNYRTRPVRRAWKLPSGCLIQEITDGLCGVLWVEHVEVDDRFQTHLFFREVVCGKNAYGAETWVSLLERMCERLACASSETLQNCDVGAMIRSALGRRSVLQLAHRMVKLFCGVLNSMAADNMEIPRVKDRSNKDAVRVSIRSNKEPGVPEGTILSAVTTFWLPIPPKNVFDFLTDNRKRPEWDALFLGNPSHEVQRISTGKNPGNCISIVRPLIPGDNNTLILQESHVDALGCMLVYGVFNMDTVGLATMGDENTSTVPVLPAGFTISRDGRSKGVEGPGSLVTMAYQLLGSQLPSSATVGQLDIQSVDAVTTLVTTTVDNIKAAFNVE
ncbi:hypothetical protein RJT34_03942 [Clitoria ternatea]|uniref:START domain-containing protein n=1 Tax=Clitoria ternatea TaxID=43366 RepID=A0AAN9KNV6_CLITE